MKIVITGGNGYIGARLSRYLADEGNHVIPVCFPSAPKNEEWRSRMSAIIEGDLRQDGTILKIAKLNPDIIIHLVSLDHFESEKEPEFVNAVNVLPTWRLLDTCTKNGLKKFIYFSTIQLYGKLSNSIIDESYPVNTINAYSLTHYLSENICDHFNRNTSANVITIRLSNSYGDPVFPENNCWWLAINDLCKSAFMKKEIRLLSDGTPQRDFIHGNDVCAAVKVLVNTNDKHKNNIYHISSGNTLTLMELAQIINIEYNKIFDKFLPIITPDGIIHQNETTVSFEKYTISNDKLKGLGFLPVYSVNRGINELFNYLENNRQETSE
jgi:UDP-glucose 4-epimerase